jgi:potassium efflux system protein
MSFRRQAHRLIIAVLLVGFGAIPWSVQAQAVQPQEAAHGVASLQPDFETGMARLQESLKAWESRVAATAVQLAQTKKELDDLQVTVATLKATMVLKKLSLLQVQGFIATYSDQGKDLKGELQDLSQEIKALQKDQQEHLEAQNALRVQFSIIQAKEPAALTPELQQSLLNYLNLAGRQDGLMAQVLEQLEQRRQLLQQEQELLVGLAPQLKHLEAAWKAELLKRPPEAFPIWQQVIQAWKSLAAIPAQGWKWLTELVKSKRLSAFILRHLAPIVGLFIFIILLGWGTRRLNDLVNRRFQAWKERTEDLQLLPLYVLGQSLIANLFGLGLILWLGLFFWSFGLISADPAQLILAALVTLWILRLSIQWVQRFFAGRAAGGVLALDLDVARFYRRSLKLFLAYLFLGLLALKSAGLLDFPESTRLFLAHIFLVGILVWGWWLLRRPYLTRLLPELSEPTWLHQPLVSLILRAVVLCLLVVIILADLLGFQNLARFLAHGAAWTLMDIAILWFLWLVGESIIRHLLHPEEGRVTDLYPEKADLIQRVFFLCRWVLSIVLGAAVILWSLHSWGIKPASVAWAFRWATWGPTLGPLKLTTVNVVGAVLALYLGIFLSRLGRGLMKIRIFPYTALDTGVQYTISTTLHYVILILAGLIALNILGFPLTNLALVLGALGVGIGFGLQNIVNNFFSGLILLFERPIKVGDMLVIDGQWGLVKEIRVRSTIFETFDRYVLVIPNSELVSNKVLNWTHYGAGINRMTLKVGVSYGSDVRQVTQLLTEVCQANPRVVPEPPPQIFFEVYGDSSLNFNIWVHLRTPSDRIPATHELNSAIFETFRQHGIEIPFPQRDLHIKDWREPLEKKGETQPGPAPVTAVAGKEDAEREK